VTGSEVSGAAGGVPVFGVFGVQSVDEILHISRAAGLHGAQLHGPYRREDAARPEPRGHVAVVVRHPAARVEPHRDLCELVAQRALVDHSPTSTASTMPMMIERIGRIFSFKICRTPLPSCMTSTVFWPAETRELS